MEKKKIKIKITFYICIIVFMTCFININYAESKSHNYKISTNSETGIETLTNEKNKKILKTKSNDETIVLMKEDVTEEIKIICVMKLKKDVNIEKNFLDQYDDTKKNFYTYIYYDSDGKKINIKDAGMKKIDYIIGNYLIYVVWENKEPIMKAYHLKAHSITILGRYNFLNIVSDTIILSKDVYGIYYDGNISKGDNNSVVCDLNLKRLKKINGYAFDSVVYIYGKQFYVLYKKDDEFKKSHGTNLLINFCDEEFKLLFTDPVYENDEFFIENKGKYKMKNYIYTFENIKQKDSSEMIFKNKNKTFKYNFITETVEEETNNK